MSVISIGQVCWILFQCWTESDGQEAMHMNPLPICKEYGISSITQQIEYYSIQNAYHSGVEHMNDIDELLENLKIRDNNKHWI